MSENTAKQIEELLERVANLESRLARLENRQTGNLSAARIPIPNSEVSDLSEKISKVLEQLGEADVSAIRQQLVKGGLPESVSRSDVNKILYADKSRFEISRQEGVKPFWHLVK